MPLYAVDWANDDENIAVFDGKKCKTTMPKPSADLVIVTENIPVKYAKPLLDEGAHIFRCNTDVVAREREKHGIEKTHEGDARIIFRLYEEQPEIFREFKIDPVLYRFNALYATFKEVQHLRIATNNRLYANGDEQVKSILDGLEKQEKEIVKMLTTSLKDMAIYTDFLVDIKGIGPATSAGLLAFVGDVKRFPGVSHMMSYFGLHVVDGKAPRKTKGQDAKWHHKGRSLLLGVIADSFVKQRTPKYRDIYDEEKLKQLPMVERPIIAEKRARRKAVKQFVKDFYESYNRLGKGPSLTANVVVDTSPYLGETPDEVTEVKPKRKYTKRQPKVAV